MRIAIVMSVAVHTAIMLWALLAPISTKSFGRSDDVPLLVDLVPPSDIAPAPEPAPPQQSVEAPPQAAPTLDSKPPQPSGQPVQHQTSARDSVASAAEKGEQQVPDTTWLQQVIEFPLASGTKLTQGKQDLEAPPSERKANLARSTIAEIKAQIMKCWVPPTGLANTHGLKVVIRVALSPTGAVTGDPTLIQAPASLSGPALVQSAMRAIQKCQPFSSLTATAYKEWKVLDLSFTPGGLSGT